MTGTRSTAPKPGTGSRATNPTPSLHQQLAHVAHILLQVRAGSALPDALARVPPSLRAGCQALGFHVMRWLGSAQAARKAWRRTAFTKPLLRGAIRAAAFTAWSTRVWGG